LFPTYAGVLDWLHETVWGAGFIPRGTSAPFFCPPVKARKTLRRPTGIRYLAQRQRAERGFREGRFTTWDEVKRRNDL
jgi:hypothetical protein